MKIQSAILALLIINASALHAKELYKWVDENGRTHYSDSAPNNADSDKIPTPELNILPTENRFKASALRQKHLDRVHAEQDAKSNRQDAKDKAEASRLARQSKADAWKQKHCKVYGGPIATATGRRVVQPVLHCNKTIPKKLAEFVVLSEEDKTGPKAGPVPPQN